MASESDPQTVEGEKDQLYYITKAKEKLQLCLFNTDFSPDFKLILLKKLEELLLSSIIEKKLRSHKEHLINFTNDFQRFNVNDLPSSKFNGEPVITLNDTASIDDEQKSIVSENSPRIKGDPISSFSFSKTSTDDKRAENVAKPSPFANFSFVTPKTSTTTAVASPFASLTSFGSRNKPLSTPKVTPVVDSNVSFNSGGGDSTKTSGFTFGSAATSSSGFFRVYFWWLKAILTNVWIHLWVCFWTTIFYI